MKTFITTFLFLVVTLLSSFNIKPLVSQEYTKSSELQIKAKAFQPTVLSSEITKVPGVETEASITITYSADWGDPNPDLTVDITLFVYEVGRGNKILDVAPILSFSGYAGDGNYPVYTGEADIPASAVITSWEINSSTPTF